MRVDIREIIIRKLLRRKRHSPEELISFLESEILDEKAKRKWEILRKI